MSTRRSLFFVLFTASGFSGLIYEALWTHYLKLFLGHAAYAQSLVLALFMGGMALGAWLAGRSSHRLSKLLRAYAGVEAVIGVAALGFHALFVAATEMAYASWLPAAPSEFLATFIKWSLASALIAPQSILLGATFPLMSAGLLRRHPERPGEAIALLYFTNSLGAAAGVLVSGFVLVDKLGLPGAMQVAGGINIALALVVWSLAPGNDPAPSVGIRVLESRAKAPAPLVILLLVALLTGTASFIYEIAWIRMLSLVLGASTHSFELMLSAFILGLAMGGLWVRARIDALARPLVFLGAVQIAMGLLALATLPLYDTVFDLMQAIMRALARTETGYVFFLASSHVIALAVMLPATFCAGMTLPLITHVLMQRGGGERSIGRVYAANTLGAILGVVFAAHIGMPLLGLKGLMLVGASIDVMLGLILLWPLARSAGMISAGTATAAFSFVLFTTTLDPFKMASGVFRRGELYTAQDVDLVYYRDGKTTSVSLLNFREGLSLRTNGKSDGAINMNPSGERIADEVTMVLTATLPLAHRPQAEDVAVIGIGTGLTTHTFTAYEPLRSIETVEIERFMAEASRHFAPINAGAFADPRSRIVIDDAKTYFSSANRRYDIIVSEPSNPWVSGVSSLFTREFYRHVKRYLKPGGVLTQWFQLYEIDVSLVASVLLALGEEFEDYVIYAATDHDLLIIAGDRASTSAQLADVFSSPGLAQELRRVHVRSLGDLEVRRLGGKDVLGPFFHGYAVPANSDFYPFLDTHAARHRFMQTSARDLTRMGLDGTPVIQILEARGNPVHTPSLEGADFLHRIEAARRANYARDLLTPESEPLPVGIPSQLQKDLELLKLRGMDCHEPERYEIWRQSALQIARLLASSLQPGETSSIWDRIAAAPCTAHASALDRDWLYLYQAIARRDARLMARIGTNLLTAGAELTARQVQYLLTAAMTGAIVARDLDLAVRLWNDHAARAMSAENDLDLRVLYGQLVAAGRTSATAPHRANKLPPG